MDRLIAYFKANRGKQKALADELGLYPSTVSQWKVVPAEHVRKVAEFTGIAPAILRPDLFEGMESAA
jgi:DNA-binding transcriptional regulator YdaS (Cro superfamily)